MGPLRPSEALPYWPRPRYVCAGLDRTFAASPGARLDGPAIEAGVVQACGDALAPAPLETCDEGLAQRPRAHRRLATSYQPQGRQAHADAPLARRRYEHGDPAYRRAAAALEHAWEDTLRALRPAQEGAARFAHAPCEPPLPMAQRQQRLNLSPPLPALGQSPPLRHAQRQALLWSLIARVMVTRTAPERIDVRIVWVSGHGSQGVVIPPSLRQREVTGHDAMVARIEQLGRAGYRDTQIADTLSREGCRSARRAQVSAATVLKIRKHWRGVSRYQQHRFADKIDAMWTIRGLAAHLGVKRAWLDKRIRSGFLAESAVIRRPPYGNYLIRDDEDLLERLQAEVQRSRQGARASPP